MREALVLKEPIDGALVRQVLSRGYAPDLDDVEVEEIGKDPFLIAAALTAIDRIVVTEKCPNQAARARTVEFLTYHRFRNSVHYRFQAL